MSAAHGWLLPAHHVRTRVETREEARKTYTMYIFSPRSRVVTAPKSSHLGGQHDVHRLSLSRCRLRELQDDTCNNPKHKAYQRMFAADRLP